MDKKYKGSRVWGAGLKKAREAAGMDRLQLADKIGYSKSAISAFEWGANRLSPTAYTALCDALPAVAELPHPPLCTRNSSPRGNANSVPNKKPNKKPSVKRMTVKRNPGLVVTKSKHAAPVPVMKRVLFSWVISVVGLMGDKRTCANIKAVIAAAAAEGVTLDELNQLFSATSNQSA